MSERQAFFIDIACSCKQVHEAVADALGEAVPHRTVFGADALDGEWLPQVCKRGWCIVTMDNRFPDKLIVNSSARVFVLRQKKMSADRWAETIRRHAASIRALAAHMPAPFKASLQVQQLHFRWLGR